MLLKRQGDSLKNKGRISIHAWHVLGKVRYRAFGTICNDRRSLPTPAGCLGGAVSPPVGPGQSPGGGPGGEAPGSS